MPRILGTLIALAICVVLGADASACRLPHVKLHDASATSATQANYWIGPAVSGAFFDSTRDGEGVVVEFLQSGRVVATWFTYPALGEDGDQAWFSAQNGIVSGDTVRFADVFRPRGGVFGPGFDPAQVVLERWGTMEMRFTDCNNVVMTYTGSGAYGSGTRTMQRLTSIDEVECSGARELTATGARALAGMRAKSGAWIVPSRDGEGWFIQELPNGSAAIFWFTFTPDGKQAYVNGVAARNGSRLEMTQSIITRGTNFGDAFDANEVERIPWGRLEFDFANCNAAAVNFASTLPGYGSAARQAARITSLGGTMCFDGTPVAKTNGQWRLESAIPPPAQSEHAATVLDSRIYMIGGFGDPRGFKRFDPVTNTWAELPDSPAGRDHLATFALDGKVFATGGAAQGTGDQTTSGFRYDPATQQWQAEPTLPAIFGSHAATLNGHAFIGNDNGALFEFDPVSRMTRNLDRPESTTPRDHSQVVAFLGEIWMIGGRFPETNSISIYDPASGRWRNGPFLARVRGGFAAAVVGDQIVVGGGEVLGTQPFSIEPTVEVYTAGGLDWRFGPNLPIPVHGVAGAGIGDRFYVLSGARMPGTAALSTGQMHSIVLQP